MASQVGYADSVRSLRLKRLLSGKPITKSSEIAKLVLPEEKLEERVLDEFDFLGVNIQTLVDYYKQKGLVGEEGNSVVQTLAAINGISFGFYSKSGSGKSYLVDVLMDLLPGNSVYKMELFSETAGFYDCAEINKAKIIYIPELQKAMKKTNSIAAELIKGISEGRDVTRVVTQGTSTRRYTIRADKSIAFTLASENEFKYDEELARRVLFLYTDESPEQTQNVILYKAAARHANGKNHLMNPEQECVLKRHIANVMDAGFCFENPFAEYLAGLMPASLKSRSYIDHFFDLVEASAKFNHLHRVKEKGTLFLGIEDVSLIVDAYWQNMARAPGTEKLDFDREACFYHGADFMKENYRDVFERWVSLQN